LVGIYKLVSPGSPGENDTHEGSEVGDLQGFVVLINVLIIVLKSGLEWWMIFQLVSSIFLLKRAML